MKILIPESRMIPWISEIVRKSKNRIRPKKTVLRSREILKIYFVLIAESWVTIHLKGKKRNTVFAEKDPKNEGLKLRVKCNCSTFGKSAAAIRIGVSLDFVHHLFRVYLPYSFTRRNVENFSSNALTK